jgi:hypothetical protein
MATSRGYSGRTVTYYINNDLMSGKVHSGPRMPQCLLPKSPELGPSDHPFKDLLPIILNHETHNILVLS